MTATNEPTIDIQKHAAALIDEALAFILGKPSHGNGAVLIARLDANGLVIAAKPADRTGNGESGNYIGIPVEDFLFEGDELKRGQYECRMDDALELYFEWAEDVLSSAGFTMEATGISRPVGTLVELEPFVPREPSTAGDW